MRNRLLFFLALAAVAGALAQEPLNFPAPLAPPPPASSPALDALTRDAARRAQELGFPAAAAGLYRELLAAPPGDRAELTLALATALLDDGRPGEARQALDGFAGPRGSAWRLRAGLAAAGEGKTDAAKAELAAVKTGELRPSDRPWYFFLQGMLVRSAGDALRADDFFQRAEQAATTDLERARFFLAHENVLLQVGRVTATLADQARKNAELLQGTATGYDFTRSYAVMLNALGRKSDAVAVLQQALLFLPAPERARADDFRLLLGLIAGAADGPGRRALIQLLESGSDPDRQRMALQLLATASPRDPERAAFRAELGKLIDAPTPYPILDDLLLFRADGALSDKDDGLAEDDARALLEKFPGSPLKAYAWSVLTGSAWEQHRYRTAADDAFQARAALPAEDSEARAELGVVVAEAWFRAGDFRSAADAYVAALRDAPASVPQGDLMFQRVQAEIAAGEAEIAAGRTGGAEPLKDAVAALDDLARNPVFDTVSRWKAEWNLARALRRNGQTAEAYARLNALLAPAQPAELPPDLHAQMAWLQAQLSLDADRPQQTLRLVDAMTADLGGVQSDLQAEIASWGALLKAEACLALNREAAGLDILNNLRNDFPKSDAAVYSYIIEADYYAQQDKIVQAQQLLTRLADDFPRSDYAPYALFRAALQAERLGQEKNFTEAYKLLESLVTKYPASPLVFNAYLKQGDLLRKLNQFPKAQQVYEWLRTKFSQNPDVIYAELALAECHNAQSYNNAQSSTDASHVESAITLFADLRDRLDAPVDMRVEAGFSLGYLYLRRGDPPEAQAVWWRDVVSAFLLDPKEREQLGPKGRYWMTRTLIEFGELDEHQGKLDEAKKAWALILETKLPGAALAQERLARYSPPAAKP